MTTMKRFIPALVLAFALPAAPIPLAAGTTPAAAAAVEAPRPFIRKVHVLVWERGSVAPNVSVHVPTFLVTTLVRTASLTGLLDRALDRAAVEAGRHGASECPLRLHGRQIDALWSALANHGPAALVEVDDGDGGRVEIRVD